MKVAVKTLDNKAAGDIELADAVFGAAMRKDILARMVQYQLAKRRAGTHKTKGVSEISGTTKKPWKQKGSGRARAGSLRSPQFRGGATIFGPVVRSHAIDLPKKVRNLALCVALSAKQAEGKLVILDSLQVKEAKTKKIAAALEKFGFVKPLIIGGAQLDEAFARAARNIKGVDILSQQGANVYDILNHKELVLTKDAVAFLEARLAKE
ncbi:MAG TPA: 50S ribosomal protein L4 [Rickettsiales bacterium]|nr:50S ribosomal protein L4 [Rickettsiales bacterium]